MPKFGRKARFPTLYATGTPVSRSNGQRSGLEVVGGIPCRPNPTTTRLVSTVIKFETQHHTM